ncbi:MAG: MFS transporter, partial [Myxococcota bacterium]
LTRPLVALAGAPAHVFTVRVLDRVGKGLRTSPRDALLARSVPSSDRGLAFGFHRGMDHAGAVIGPLLALLLLRYSDGDLRLVFGAALGPGLLALFVLVIFVRDVPTREVEAVETAEQPSRARNPSRLLAVPPRRLAPLLGPVGLITLASASDLFLLLAVGVERVPLEALPLLWVGLHVVKSASSPLGGWWADRSTERRVLATGWMLLAACYVGFAVVDEPLLKGALLLLYGMHHGLSEGPEKALVARLASDGEVGTAFGWYHLTCGLLALPAGLWFGALWQSHSQSAAFLTGATLAALATMWLLRLPADPRREPVASPTRT